MFRPQPQHARRRTGFARLLLLLALLPLLQLPLPVLHAHDRWSQAENFPVSLQEHVHHCHHDEHDGDHDAHWHFLQLGDLSWLGLSVESPLLQRECQPATVGSDFLREYEFSLLTQLLGVAGEVNLRPPPLLHVRERQGLFFSTHASYLSARTFLVQLLCEQQC